MHERARACVGGGGGEKRHGRLGNLFPVEQDAWSTNLSAFRPLDAPSGTIILMSASVSEYLLSTEMIHFAMFAPLCSMYGKALKSSNLLTTRSTRSLVSPVPPSSERWRRTSAMSNSFLDGSQTSSRYL